MNYETLSRFITETFPKLERNWVPEGVQHKCLMNDTNPARVMKKLADARTDINDNELCEIAGWRR